MSSSDSLRITEIFHSLQGETTLSGLPTVFVRLTGCPLRCAYCDSAYAFHGGQRMSIQSILDQVSVFQTRHVTVTGGEPLAQPAVHTLMAALCDAGHTVSLETSGAMDVSSVDARVIKILDLKTPASAEMDRNRIQNIDFLDAKDQVKFVICDRNDYDWAKQMIDQYQLTTRCEVLLSPSYQQVPYEALAQWMLDDRLPVRFQVQLHKLIWSDKPGV